MKKKISLLILLLSLTMIIAENPLELNVPQGKSNFTVSEYFPSFYVKKLIQSNPEIQSITIQEYGQTFGYLNALGGIGTNFLIEPNRNYEIYVKEAITIKLKD